MNGDNEGVALGTVDVVVVVVVDVVVDVVGVETDCGLIELVLKLFNGAGSSIYGVSSMPPSASIAASRGTGLAVAPEVKFFATTVAFLLSS